MQSREIAVASEMAGGGGTVGWPHLPGQPLFVVYYFTSESPSVYPDVSSPHHVFHSNLSTFPYMHHMRLTCNVYLVRL